jgi:hypothetical protein
VFESIAYLAKHIAAAPPPEEWDRESGAAAAFAGAGSPKIPIESSEERCMIALGLIRVIERHSDELAAELIAKLETSSRTTDLRKVPVEELRRGIQEIFWHLGEWLLTKTSHDIEQRYFEIGGRRASQGVALSDYTWSIVLTKEYIWEFLQRQQVGTTQLRPGNYKVKWEGAGPDIQVTFLRDGRNVATVPATLKTNDGQVTQDEIVTNSANNTLTEIASRRDKQALMFQQSGI